MRYSLHRHLDHLATERWARQSIRRLLRAAWLSACVWCIGLGGSMLWGWPLRYDVLSAASLLIIGLGVLSLLRPRLKPAEVARRLDRRFLLDEQLATAVEVAETAPDRDSVGGQLLAHAGRTAGLVRQRIAQKQAMPWNDVLSAVALALVLLGLYLLAGIGRVAPLGAVLPEPPALVGAEDPAGQLADEPFSRPDEQVLVPGAGEGTQAMGAGPGDAQSLGAIADALRDQGATRAAAEALDRGDPATAAQRLRELADQAGQLSRETRGNLADRLEQAARELDGRNPQLADQLRESAAGLERGGQAAEQALEDLARAIEQLQQPAGPSAAQEQQGQPGAAAEGQGEQPGQGQGQGEQPGQGQAGQGDPFGQGQGQGQGRGGGAASDSAVEQRQSAPSQRLGVPGQPLTLEAEGGGQSASGGNDQGPTSSGSASGFTSGGSAAGNDRPIGADPLRVPLEDRNVVQEYFSK